MSDYDEVIDRLDVAILACRVAYPTAEEVQVMATFGMSTRPHPGSVLHACSECGRDVFVGPRQQDLLADRPDKVKVCCLLCAAVLASEAETQETINLGSVHPDEPNPNG